MKAIAGKTIVPLLERPSSQTTLDDELLYGMVVEVLEETADEDGADARWLLVRTPYRYTGYCKKEDMILDGARVEAWEGGELCVVMQRYADVLSESRVQGICLESLARGGRLLVHREAAAAEPGWVCVELADGRRGYTKEKFLGPYYSTPFTADEDAFRRRLVEMAKGYLGTQYRWGGKSTLGIDCSGLTSMCYMLCGVYIYRNAGYVDSFAVHEIPAEDRKPGDLLYFPGHIAMYIGDDRYIHSTGRSGDDGVVINSLNPAHGDFREDLLGMLERVGSIFG